MRVLAIGLFAAGALGVASAAPAQAVQQRFQSEGRLDAIIAHAPAIHAGYGLSVPTSLYIRTGIVVGAGVGRHGADGRADLIARFTLDPFRQSRWAPYGGGGLSGRFRSSEDGGSRAFLLVFVGLEGPLRGGARSGIVPAVEIGLGGGTRVGIVLRRGVAARR